MKKIYEILPCFKIHQAMSRAQMLSKAMMHSNSVIITSIFVVGKYCRVIHLNIHTSDNSRYFLTHTQVVRKNDKFVLQYEENISGISLTCFMKSMMRNRKWT